MLLIARWLNDNGYTENLDPNEFVRLLKEGGEEAAQVVRRSFKLSRQSD
jgi:hypothetical protein